MSTITTINNTDKVGDSRAVINTNFSNLNTGKAEVSSGAVAPTSIPERVGDIYIDTTARITYVAKGTTSSADWQRVSQLDKYDGTVAPTVNEDSGGGYSVGSVWIDTTNDKAYICLDNTVTAAVWTEITQSGGGGGAGTDIIVPFKPISGVQPNGLVYLGRITKAGTIGGVIWGTAGLPVGSARTLNILKNGTATTDSIFTSDTPSSMPTTKTADSSGRYSVTNVTIDNGTVVVGDDLWALFGGGSTSKTWDDSIDIVI